MTEGPDLVSAGALEREGPGYKAGYMTDEYRRARAGIGASMCIWIVALVNEWMRERAVVGWRVVSALEVSEIRMIGTDFWRR